MSNQLQFNQRATAERNFQHIRFSATKSILWTVCFLVGVGFCEFARSRAVLWLQGEPIFKEAITRTVRPEMLRVQVGERVTLSADGAVIDTADGSPNHRG